MAPNGSGFKTPRIFLEGSRPPYLNFLNHQKSAKMRFLVGGSRAVTIGGPGGLLWLGWLACCAQPWLGLAWACLACLALAWSSNNNRPPSAAGGGFAAAVVVAGPGQGKAGMTGPGQTRPRRGTTGKPAKPKQNSGMGMGMSSNFVTTRRIVKNMKELTTYLTVRSD